MHANAKHDRTMSYEQIALAIVEEAIEIDAAETARRGDERPAIVATDQGHRLAAGRRPRRA